MAESNLHRLCECVDHLAFMLPIIRDSNPAKEFNPLYRFAGRMARSRDESPINDIHTVKLSDGRIAVLPPPDSTWPPSKLPSAVAVPQHEQAQATRWLPCNVNLWSARDFPISIHADTCR